MESPRSRNETMRIVFQISLSEGIQKLLLQHAINFDITWIYNAIDYLNWIDYMNAVDETMVNKQTAERILCAGIEFKSLVDHLISN